jgi:hypothetical protein
MKLPIVDEPVDPPRPLSDARRMAAIPATLRELGYDVAACAARLKTFPRLGVNFWDQMRPEWKPNLDDPVDALITLFVDSHPLGADRLKAHTSRGTSRPGDSES